PCPMRSSATRRCSTRPAGRTGASACASTCRSPTAATSIVPARSCSPVPSTRQTSSMSSATAQPRVRFLNLGVSSLDFQLSVWIDEPALRELVIDEMTTRVYKALNAAGFEIPFPKQDVYVKALPPSDGGA